MTNKIEIPLLACCLLVNAVSTGYAAKPLFRNSIVSTEIDFITDDDASAFKTLSFISQERREMPDKRNEDLFDREAFTFRADFSDGSHVDIWAHSSFGSKKVARRYAMLLAGPLGKLPAVMRGRLSHVVVHSGDETAFAESDGHFFVLYSKNMETRVRNHGLEETVFHESVHATLDAKHNKSDGWLLAQKNDDAFITEYAAKNPGKEDLPESALFAFTMMKHPGRLSSDVEQWVENHMANRFAYFRTLFADVNRKTNATSRAPSLPASPAPEADR